jgi:methyltransferase family protein
VRYLDFLERVHEVLEPPTYLEIGIRHGDSLALARTATSVGIDPAYELRTKLRRGTELFRETSDEYFDRPDPLEPFEGRPPALSFIDGLHLVEYALRDFINVERHADWSSVVVFDDIFPANVQIAARKRRTRRWTGDVYKILGILSRHRPDLICLRVDTEPTGLLLVLGLDPENRTLDRRYDEILLETVAPDPQRVPEEVLARRDAIDPERLLSASFWSLLREARDGGVDRGEGLGELRRRIESDVGGVRRPRAGALAR